jgi:hypothetical protein
MRPNFTESQAEYAKVLFGEESHGAATQTINLEMSDQTRMLVAAHAKILTGQDLDITKILKRGTASTPSAVQYSPAASAGTGHTPARTITAETLQAMFPSPAGVVRPVDKALTPFTAAELQSPLVAAPTVAILKTSTTPTVSMHTVAPRRMSFNTQAFESAQQSNDGHSMSVSMSVNNGLGQVRTGLAAPLTAMELDHVAGSSEVADVDMDAEDTTAAADEQVMDHVDDSAPLSALAEFFATCGIAFVDRVSSNRRSSVNGFVQRDGKRTLPVSLREELILCGVDNVALDLMERQCTRWQDKLESLRASAQDAELMFQDQPVPVMQMLPLVPAEQIPEFVLCMQQQRDRALVEAQLQRAAVQLEDENISLQTWQEHVAATQTDVNVAADAVAALTAIVTTQGASTSALLAQVQDQVDASASVIDECMATQEVLEYRCHALQSSLTELTAARSEAISARLALESDPVVQEQSQAVRARQLLQRQAAKAQDAALQTETAALQRAVPWCHLNVGAGSLKLMLGRNTFLVNVNWDVSTGQNVQVTVTVPATARPYMDRAFLNALIREVPTAAMITRVGATRASLPTLMQELDSYFGRVGDMLDELEALGAMHAFVVDTKITADSVPTASVAFTVKMPAVALPARVEMEFDLSVGYPFAPMPARLRDRALHDLSAVLGDALPGQVLDKIMTQTHAGWGRLTGVCTALRSVAMARASSPGW